MKNDPADNGGLFVGRRPGTAPVRFRKTPERGGARRQKVDASFANLLLFTMFAFLFGTLIFCRRLDETWILVRRAAGYDQRNGILGRVFACAAVVGGLGFTFWFLVINGPGLGA
jgi:hypothetical protein